MNHFEKICEYIRLNSDMGGMIERREHVQAGRDYLLEQCSLYTPECAVKAGAGDGSLIMDIAGHVALLVVVEPDFEVLSRFCAGYKDDPRFQSVRCVNGDLHNLPLDWYCADMIICFDYLDFHNVATVLDEFKRIVDFEGKLVLGGTVLHDDDIDGIYDELFRKIIPLHNDYYILGDLRTILGLKKFTEIDHSVVPLPVSLEQIYDIGKKTAERIGEKADTEYTDYLQTHSQQFRDFYAYNNADGSLTELYSVSTYKSEKPEKKDYEEEVAEYTRKMGRS